MTIISSDKDLMQLVGDGVDMLDPMKNKRIGPDEVFEKFGVGPDKLGEVLALMGEDVKGALQQSINDFQTPALAPSTVEAKGFAKPLIDTAHMLNSVTFKVEP